MSRHPHTWRFYRKRFRGFCRKMVWILSLVMLGIFGGIENGSLPVGFSVFQLVLLSVLVIYSYSVGYGFQSRKKGEHEKQV